MKTENLLVQYKGVPLAIYKKITAGWVVYYVRSEKTGNWSNDLGSGLIFETQKKLKEFYKENCKDKEQNEFTIEKINFNDYLKQNYEQFI